MILKDRTFEKCNKFENISIHHIKFRLTRGPRDRYVKNILRLKILFLFNQIKTSIDKFNPLEK